MTVGGGFAYLSDGNKLRRLDLATNAVTTVAVDDGSGCQVTPTGVLAVDASYLYFLSSCVGNYWIRRMALSTGVISVMLTNVAPRAMVVSPAGALYMVSNYDKVQQINTTTFAVTTVATIPPVAAYTSLSGLTADADGLWVVDEMAKRLLKVDPVAGTSTQVSANEVSAPIASLGSFIYAQVSGKNEVRQFAKADGSSITVAGAGPAGYIDATGAQAWIGGVGGLAGDGTRLLLADSGSHRVRALVSAPTLPMVQPAQWSNTVTLDGATFTRIAGGATGVVDGRGAAVGFFSPSSIHVVGGFAYVADYSRLRKVNVSTGQVTTVAGSGTLGCQDALTPTSANITPGALTDDGEFLYFLNNCGYNDTYLRRMSLATGAISTLFYRTGYGYSSLTTGPSGGLFMGVDNQILRVNTDNATTSTMATLPTPGGVLSITRLTSDSQNLFALGRYDCQGYGGGCSAIYQVNPTTGASTLIADSSTYWGANYASGDLISAGDFLYGPWYKSNYADGSSDVGLGRWSKSTGAFHPVTAVHLASGAPSPFSYGGLDVDAHGLVLTDSVSKQVLRAINLPSPIATCGQCLSGESQGGTDLSEASGTQNCHCDPINTATGALFESATDLAVPGRGFALAYSRTYDTQVASQAGRLGYGWTDGYGMKLAVDSSSSGPLATAGVLALTQENGSIVRYVRNADGSYSAASRVVATLVRNGDGTFTFTRRAQGIFSFDATGRLTSERDLNSYITTLAYDGSGRLSTVTEPAGRALTLAYDANNRVSSVTDTAGRTVTYTYNASGELTTVVDVRGKTWTYGYDAAHRVTSMTNPRNGTTTTGYDADGKAISQTDPANRTTTFDYTVPTDTGSWVVTITDPRGIVSRETYDHADLVSETKAVGTTAEATWSYAYDVVSNARVSTTDPLGHTWSTSYDSSGNVLSSSDPLGHGASATYNALNEPLTVTDANGVVTTHTYDAAGNLLSTSTPLVGSSPAVSATSTYTYGDVTDPGDVTSTTDARGKVWTRTFDAFGQVTSTTDPLGNKATSDYTCTPVGPGCRSNVGWVYASVAPRGNVAGGTPADYRSTVTRDDGGLPLTTTNPLGKSTTYEYDGNGNRTKVTDANNHATSYVFDADDELTTVTRPDTTTLGTSYDANGNVLTQTNGAGKVTSYTYDPLNRARTMTDPLNRTTTSAYDLVGRLTTTTDASSRITTYGYDIANRRISITYSDAVTPNVTFGFDAVGRRTSMTDGSGSSSYVFDSLGRMTSATNGAGKSVSYGYDLAGNQTSIIYPNGRTVTRAVDDAGELTGITDWLSHTTAYTPDPNGNALTVTAGNGIVTTNTFDHADRLMGISHKLGAATVASFGYTRDDTGLLTADSPTGVGTPETYGYDALNRLTGRNSATYGYDAADNLTSLTDGTAQSFDVANQIGAAQPAISLVGTGSAQDNGTGGSLSVTLPASRVAGDVVLLSVVTATGQTVNTPAGYTARGTYAPGGNQTKVTTFSRAVVSGDSGPVAVSFGTGVTANAVLAAVYRGVTAAAPVEASATGSTTATSSLTVPSVTSLTDGARLVLLAGETANAAAESWTAPAGMTDQVHATGQALVSAVLFDQPLGAAGATGTRTTAVSLPGNLVGALWALKPIAPTTFGYDGVGDRTSRVDPLTGTSSYGYDQASRLTSFNGSAATYAYDGNGLRTSKSVSGVTSAFTWDPSAGLPLLLDDGIYSYLYGPGGTVVEQIQNTPAITVVGTGSKEGNSSATSVAVTLPPGLRVRDQILLSVTANATQTINTPAGYTLVQAATGTGNTSQTVVFRRTAVGNESSATVTFGTGLTPKAVLAVVYRGVDATNPIDVKTTGSANLATSLTVGSVTTTGANERLVLLAGATGNTAVAAWTPPGGMTDRVHASTQTLVSTLVADQSLGAAGGTGGRTATIASSGDLTGVLLALKLAPAATYYYEGDQLGSVRVVTDQLGAVAATYSYDPYGTTVAHTGYLDTPFQYTGQYRDVETAFYYLRARYYDPTTAQFLTRDPVEALTGAPYAYVEGNPLNGSDPSGLMCLIGHNAGGGCRGANFAAQSGAAYTGWMDSILPTKWVRDHLGIDPGVECTEEYQAAANLAWGPPMPGKQVGMVVPGGVGGDGAAASSLSMSEKIVGQMGPRGWSEALMQETVENPAATHSVWDFTSGTRQAATAYARSDGSYVVVNDSTNAVVQVSDINKVGWKPVWDDPRFQR
jgi:RHS repeat-associated protein